MPRGHDLADKLSRDRRRIVASDWYQKLFPTRLPAQCQAMPEFTWKDYRIEGPDRYKTMTLPTDEFIRRFLMHVLPKGLHRIRQYGLFATAIAPPA